MKKQNGTQFRVLAVVAAACLAVLFMGAGSSGNLISDPQFRGTNIGFGSNQTAAAFQNALDALATDPYTKRSWVTNFSATSLVTAATFQSSNANLQGQINLKLATSTFDSSTNSLWSAITGKADASTFDASTNSLWSAVNGKVGQAAFDTATNSLTTNVNARVAQSTFDLSTNSLWSSIASKLNLSGGTMTGLLDFSGTNHAGIRVNNLTGTERDALTPTNGFIIYNTTANRVEKYENGAWRPTEGSGTGITSLNGETDASQSFGANAYGSFVSGSGVHTFSPSNAVAWQGFVIPRARWIETNSHTSGALFGWNGTTMYGIAPGSNGQVLMSTNGAWVAAASPGGGGTMNDLTVLQHTNYSAGGGTFILNQWTNRPINQVFQDADNNVLELNNNRFRLAANTYEIKWAVSAFQVNNFKSRLIDDSTTNVVMRGTTEFSGASSQATTKSIGCGDFTVSDTNRWYAIQMRCAATKNDDGFGQSSGIDDPEIYAIIEIRKK